MPISICRTTNDHTRGSCSSVIAARNSMRNGWDDEGAVGMKERLVGTWRLLSYETDELGGKRGKPYGDAVGRLEYDDHGNMSGQVMRPGRAHVERGDGNAQQVRAAY